MTGDGPGHLDEDDQPCARHGPANLDVLLSLALVGSRSPGFNHDLASKLQGLLMALHELDELLAKRDDEDLRRVVDEAASAAQGMAELLTANRALTRAAPPTPQPLREMMQLAGERAGVVVLGELPDVAVAVAAPVVTHALALAVAVAAGPNRGAPLAATCRRFDHHLELSLALVTPSPAYAGEHLALASEMLRRDGGDLRCGPDRLVIRLPIR